jgi:hypothetical protein
MASFRDTLICFFTLVLPIGIFVAFAIRTAISRRREKHNQIIVWKEYAEDNNLKFTPDSFLGRQKNVTGIYRDYYIELFTSWLEEDQRNHFPYTNIQLSIRHRFFAGKSNTVNIELGDEEITWKQLVDFLVPNGLVCRSRERVQITVDAERIHYQHRDFEEDKQYLSSLVDMLCDLVDNYPRIVNLGGEIVPALQELAEKQGHPLHSSAIFLLEVIASRSRDLRISYPKLLCPCCFLRFKKQKIESSWWKTLSYYACPNCHQNRDYFSGQVVVVLNNQMEKEYVETENILKVNWLEYRKIFDFDAVEIEQATDEDVERFVVQVGNDTDEARKSHYAKMRCVVAPNCELSENTIRILQHTFGNVETMAGAGVQL